MEFITHFFQALKSPKTALVLFLFSGALLFFPIDQLGLEKPEFTDAYQTQILLVFFLASAILILEIITWMVSTARAPFRKRAREKAYQESIEKVFFSLNLSELCVLWVMTQSGTKTIKASYDNHVMVSLRQKNALGLLPGPQSLFEAHHYMPDALYDLVAERGYQRMPEDFKNSAQFEDEVREIVHRSTSWNSWG
ncbi:super-infection exclusion protein B [Pseudovibrio sp. Tun.PSC04-5.I4]|uniref:super-infection exclusion protein B n=1 Tax=Pseudovibrio sp. Tun.PSC04-5.I4 TaxID=1798213 RepID=UPI00088FF625|nr:super-infection exclusion protein B [Pseudovibrio sp. Tun.PSC04-5.I4]SDQ73345.1 Superinfection exclusion protein B [Pseudovibrio sp. Tun.PSC04-5.I4]